MKLTFKGPELQAILKHSTEAKKSCSLYDKKTGKGLWLVGDRGIYLMSNGKPGLIKPKTKKENVVCYAEECNPEKDPDGWYDTKVATFGGDDGAEFIPLPKIEGAVGAEITLTPRAINVAWIRRRK